MSGGHGHAGDGHAGDGHTGDGHGGHGHGGHGHGGHAAGAHGPVEIPAAPATRFISPARADFERPWPGRLLLWPVVWTVVAALFGLAAQRGSGPVELQSAHGAHGEGPAHPEAAPGHAVPGHETPGPEAPAEHGPAPEHAPQGR